MARRRKTTVPGTVSPSGSANLNLAANHAAQNAAGNATAQSQSALAAQQQAATAANWTKPPAGSNWTKPPTALPSYKSPELDNLTAANDAATGNTIADLIKQAGYAQAEYGYTGQDTNNDGIPDAKFEVDPSNPFSKAALLQRVYDQRGEGIGNALGARGHYFSGAYQTEQDANKFQRDQATDQNLSGFQQTLSQILGQIAGTKVAGEQQNSQLNWDALMAALARQSQQGAA